MKRLVIWLLAVVVLLVPLTSCCPQERLQQAWDYGYEQGKTEGRSGGYTQEDLDAAHQAGYDEGYNIGHEQGYDAGSIAGYRVGYDEGQRYGYTEGFHDAIVKIVDEWFLSIISVTSPVSPGQNATLRAITLPNAFCAIDVYYKSGKSEAAGLYPHRADEDGWISWTWKVGTRTTPGRWKIIVTASDVDGWFPGETTLSQTTYFEVQ